MSDSGGYWMRKYERARAERERANACLMDALVTLRQVSEMALSSGNPSGCDGCHAVHYFIDQQLPRLGIKGYAAEGNPPPFAESEPIKAIRRRSPWIEIPGASGFTETR